MDLIDRQVAIDIVRDECRCGEQAELIEELEALPSAQPDLSSYSDKLWRSAYERGKAEAQAEIIRCRDCKHYIRSNATNLTVCNKDNGLPYTVEGTDFCSRAERRTDEQTD